MKAIFSESFKKQAVEKAVRRSPGDDVPRVIIHDRRQEVPAPTHHPEVGEARLPQFMYPAGRVLELV